ncbi:MAG: hypothetical protein ACYCXT_13960 [Acidiferrobacteraceae bacterium]
MKHSWRATSLVGAVALGIVLAGCASNPPRYVGAFSNAQGIAGDTALIPAPLGQTWTAALQILPQRGFLVQRVDSRDHIIMARREIQGKHNAHKSYAIHVTITLVPATPQATNVILAANHATLVAHSEHTWWHLLWIVPLFPTGTTYTTVITHKGTVHSAVFYQNFFAAVRAAVKPLATPVASHGPVAPHGATPPGSH